MSLLFKTALERYFEDLEERGCSQSTLISNRQWLGLFVRFCGKADVVEVSAISFDLLARFRQHIVWTPGVKGALYSQSTLFQCQRMVRSWLRWLHSKDLLLQDVTTGWILRRPSARVRKVPSIQEMSRLLLSSNETTALGLRNRAVLELLYGTGLRVSECSSLDLGHVDFVSSRLQVVCGKGQKDRILPLGARLQHTLQRYLEQRPLLVSEGEQALFVRRSGQRISNSIVYDIVKTSSKAADLEHLGPHTIRHAFATHLLENGADIAVIGALLGHKNLNATHIYTRLCFNELSKVYRKTHPRAQRQS